MVAINAVTSIAGVVVATASSARHSFKKPMRESIRLISGLGVEGDAHLGVAVKHRSRVRRDPSQPNLRQVHLMHEELEIELRAAGYHVGPGTMGENITTRGVDLLALPQGTRLRIGENARVEVTGLRNPCRQLNDFQNGLMQAVLARDSDGRLIRKAGIMGIVLAGGIVRPGDVIEVELPAEPHRPLEPI